MGSNNDIRLGIVGFNSHGKSHIRRFQAIPKGVRIVALCDADTDVIDRGVKEFFNGRGQKVDTYTDIRELLDRDDIDAISGAQPNHWHSLAAVWACQAGKDVCVEKPVSHNVWEGRKVVEAARKYNRVVQADLDRRTSEGRALAHKYVQEGKLGKIIRAHSFVYKRRESMGKLAKPVQPPASVDYNLWSGAARVLPVTRERFHYDWHWLWEYGGGETCNNGPHTLDVVRACLGHMGLPKRVMAYGGRYGYDDVGETPNTQVAILDYEPAPI
jgi:predicted dehydrogenase